MRITRARLQRYDLRLKEPYTIAYETVSEAVNYVLLLETQESGLTGYGCAAPDLTITSETPETFEKAFENVVKPALEGADPFYISRILQELKDQGEAGPSCRAMVDMALRDLMAKAAGQPLYKLLGAYRDSIPTSVTIGILPVSETLQKAQEWVDRGFFILKIKGGLDVEEDIRKLRDLHQRFPQIKLRFDGNQGFSLEQALHFADEVEHLGLEILEQPLLISEEHHYHSFSKRIPQPVMADESVKTLQDTFRLARHELVDMINIKLMKVGGIQEGMHINSVSRSAGYEVMVGCLDECQLGISAGLHFALSRPNIEFADLDSHLDFEKDPFEGLFHLKDGVLYPNELAGLGVR